jgi:hypothetical protein
METTLARRDGNSLTHDTVRHRKSTTTRVVCPTCATSTRVDKVSSVVRRGRGRMIWESGDVAHYETELSELLAPPSPPQPLPIHRLVIRTLTSFLVLGVLLALIIGLEAQDYLTIEPSVIAASRRIAIAWFALIVPALLVFQWVRARSNYRKLLPLWMSARRRWSGLYYCPGDDLVFAPTLGKSAAPADIESLIYPVMPIVSTGQPSPHPPTVGLPNRGHLRTAK